MPRTLQRSLPSLIIILALAAPAAATTYGTFNVRDFGAAGDGAAKDAVAFQKALDTCAVSGGGTVVIPAGRYLNRKHPARQWHDRCACS